MSRQLWRVVGGEQKGGILVRHGASLSSAVASCRLSTGSLVRQVCLSEARLQYEKLSGDGPESGWVSLRHHDKHLLVAEEQAPRQSLSNDEPFASQTSIDERSGAFRLCTWNLLAPCYFRASTGKEVTTRFWRRRIEAQFYVAFEVIKPDIMCFQELWFSPTVLSILGEAAKQHDYQLVTCRRPGMKQDGVCILVRRSVFTVEASQEMEICAVGDRVALLVLLRGCTNERQPLIVGTAHFSFPHGDADDQRYLQAKRTMNGCYKFAQEKGLDPHDAPLILAGDLNCETTVAADEAVGVLLNDGWRSTFAEANGKDALATHITHRNTHSCADLVLLHGAASAGSALLLPAEEPDTSSIPRPQVGGAQHLSGSIAPSNLFDWSQLSDHRPLIATIVVKQSASTSPTSQHISRLEGA